MAEVAFFALWAGLTVLVLVVGYCYGRAEMAAECNELVERQQDTIDALLTPRVSIVDE